MSTEVRVTREQYDQMIAEGVFEGSPRVRVELIRGEVRPMSPIGAAHEDLVDDLTRWSVLQAPQRKVRVRVQNSVELPGADTVPEPDLVWAVQKSYRRRRPQAQDLFLIIEVADSGLHFDLNEKATLYAEAGIADNWVVDVNGRRITVFRDPRQDRFRSQTTHEAGDTICPLAFPTTSLAVADLFTEE